MPNSFTSFWSLRSNELAITRLTVLVKAAIPTLFKERNLSRRETLISGFGCSQTKGIFS